MCCRTTIHNCIIHVSETIVIPFHFATKQLSLRAYPSGPLQGYHGTTPVKFSSGVWKDHMVNRMKCHVYDKEPRQLPHSAAKVLRSSVCQVITTETFLSVWHVSTNCLLLLLKIRFVSRGTRGEITWRTIFSSDHFLPLIRRNIFDVYQTHKHGSVNRLKIG